MFVEQSSFSQAIVRGARARTRHFLTDQCNIYPLVQGKDGRGGLTEGLGPKRNEEPIQCAKLGIAARYSTRQQTPFNDQGRAGGTTTTEDLWLDWENGRVVEVGDVVEMIRTGRRYKVSHIDTDSTNGVLAYARLEYSGALDKLIDISVEARQ